MSLKSVKVPDQMVPLFAKAEEYVKNYFSSYQSDKAHGSITIGGERYILVRAKSLRVDFAKHIGSAMGLSDDMADTAADNFLYILAKSIGQEDAKRAGMRKPSCYFEAVRLEAPPFHTSLP